MSAFMCDDLHIATLADGALEALRTGGPMPRAEARPITDADGDMFQEFDERRWP